MRHASDGGLDDAGRVGEFMRVRLWKACQWWTWRASFGSLARTVHDLIRKRAFEWDLVMSAFGSKRIELESCSFEKISS
ncbi:hypothetical protein VTL71DRAFT_11072 [Oculimacula yallundae]|uniref:Uncharacterized protein n=1 Tax=Oculimacula yallundae TaxID=86028 RepID=A0ABR4CWB9_9HELO